MAQEKKSDGSQYENIDGGRVVDRQNKTVYSKNQSQQMNSELLQSHNSSVARI